MLPADRNGEIVPIQEYLSSEGLPVAPTFDLTDSQRQGIVAVIYSSV
jgi:hypothetical protein